MSLKTGQMRSFQRKFKNTICCGAFFRFHVLSMYNNNSIFVVPTNIVRNKEIVLLQ